MTSTHISADIANIHQSTNQTSPLHMQDIERDSRGEAMVHDSGEDWVYAYTGVISEIKE